MANQARVADGHSGMASKRSSGTSFFEFFLYSAIILETALAAFVYKVILRDTDLRASNAYLVAAYFGFLAWAILQLNRLHRRRKFQPAELPPAVPSEMPEAALAAPQNVVMLENRKPALRIFGLTAAQLLIILVVFAAALKSFTWALASMHYDR